MLKNYIKLTIKVLGRKKFYTFISLFGISFTLMVLMILMAFLDTELGSNAPFSKADRMLTVDRIQFSTTHYDTIYQVDSQLVAGEMVIDTLNFETKESGQSISSGSPGKRVFEDFLHKAAPYEKHTVFFNRGFDVFQSNRKYSLSALHTDANYWEIFDFNFIDGRNFMANEVANANSVAVVTDRMAEDFFGNTENIIGREITLSGRSFTIIGMVETPRSSNDYVRADIYLPLSTASERLLSSTSLQGPFVAVFLANHKDEVAVLKSSLEFLGKNITIPPEMASYEQVKISAYTNREKYAWLLFFDDDPKQSLRKFNWTLFGLLGFFILIPTLNLINLNLSRMLERAAEISVRKAFGADSRQILIQFLFENIILTLLGGIIGFVLALIIIYLINDSHILPNTILHFNWRVALISLGICLGFGILSGLLPAYKMSRQHIADGL